MGDAKKGLGWVRDGVLEGLPEVSRMREEGGPVGSKSVQFGLLVPRLGSHFGLGALVALVVVLSTMKVEFDSVAVQVRVYCTAVFSVLYRDVTRNIQLIDGQEALTYIPRTSAAVSSKTSQSEHAAVRVKRPL